MKSENELEGKQRISELAEERNESIFHSPNFISNF